MKRNGFTLIELLVVIAIIAVLAAILFPVFLEARRAARGTKCMSNLRNIGLAVRAYNENWNARYMPALGVNTTGYMQNSFVNRLQPYVRNREIFLCPSAPRNLFKHWWDPGGIDEMNANAADSGWHSGGGSTGYPLQRSHYGQNINISGLGQGGHIAFESEIKRPSRVLYMCDARWVDLSAELQQPGRIGMARFRHNGGCQALCCDGHVKWIPAGVLIKWPEDPNPPVTWQY